jgi:nucleotide-binding universal stress UspA family protein
MPGDFRVHTLISTRQESEEMKVFNNVLVGVDGRLGGRDAIALASQLRAADGDLTLATVYPGLYMPTHAVTPGLMREESAAAITQLERECSETRVAAKCVAIQAPAPGRGLHVQAEDQQADLLVVGSSHHGILGRTFVGNDTLAALNGAPCAIAVAPHGYSRQKKVITTIGVGYDGSPESEAAIEVARAIAAQTGSPPRALEVASIPSYSFTGAIGPILMGIDEMVAKALAHVEELKGVVGEAEYGFPGEELAKFSGEVDLLIVGSRNYGPVHRLVSGSTARYLLRHARGPVLVLPRGTRYATPDRSEADAQSETPTHASA